MKNFILLMVLVVSVTVVVADTVDTEKLTAGNIQFSTANNGTVGFIWKGGASFDGQTYWPRGSHNMYMFGGGIWFGARKQISGTSNTPKPLVIMGYNPNSGQSWLTPGAVADGSNSNNTANVYNSSKFSADTGTPIVGTEVANWPIWITNPNEKTFLSASNHRYELDVDKRNKNYYSEGPLFVSSQDLVTVYNDNDLGNYEQGVSKSGYPIGVEIKQNIYAWNDKKFQDALIISYTITNISNDTLRDCSFGFVGDIDIARKPYLSEGATNDRVRFYNEDPSLNMGLAWTDTNNGESGSNFGYIGISVLETPAYTFDNPTSKRLRNDKLIYKPKEQIGISTYIGLTVENDAMNDGDRYNRLLCGKMQSDEGPGDRRILTGSAPFLFAPNETCRFAVALTFALPSKGGEADGSTEDVADLVQLNKDLRTMYYAVYSSILVNERLKHSETLNIFPNPASEYITLPEQSNTLSPYVIYDICGSSVQTGESMSKIDISELPTGVYLLFVDSKSYKFVKE